MLREQIEQLKKRAESYDGGYRGGYLTALADMLALIPREPALSQAAEIAPRERTPGDPARAALIARLEKPPQHVINFAVERSCESPCQSKRGVVIFNGDNFVSHGYNFKPRGFDCDGSDVCKGTCRAEAVHAEQMALLAAGSKAFGAELLHVKTVNGVLVASGGPSCVQCSKLILASGVAGIWLYHEDGWKRYPADEFHRLSLAALAVPLAPQEELWGVFDGEKLELAYPRQKQAECYAAAHSPAAQSRITIRKIMAAPGQAEPWQDIASAPKDGTHIDLWAKTWLPAFDKFTFQRFPDCVWMKGDPMVNRDPYWLNLSREWVATHWMSLPLPPTTERSA